MSLRARRLNSPRVAFVATALFLTPLSAACGSSSQSAPAEMVTVTRPAGSWQGSGNQTIGFLSDSGRFRVQWEARRLQPSIAGRFRLVVHSAVSGRPIQVIADQQGEGSGSGTVNDDPRPYNFMIDSANLEWTVSVEEVVAMPADPRKPQSLR